MAVINATPNEDENCLERTRASLARVSEMKSRAKESPYLDAVISAVDL